MNGSVPGFTQPEIEAVANRLVNGAERMKVGLMSHMGEFSNQGALTTGLVAYETLIINVMTAKPECVSKEMKRLASDAVTKFQECLPDQATMKADMEKGQAKIEDLLNKLREVDSKMKDVEDPVIRAQMTASADVDIVGAFCLEVTHRIFTGMTPILSCTQTAAIDLRNQLLSFISQAGQCYATGH